MSRAQKERRIAQEIKERRIEKLAEPVWAVFLVLFIVVGVCYYKDIGWLGHHGRVILDLIGIVFFLSLPFFMRAAARRKYYRR